ncbi:MAG: UDP-N-acetylglucosamine 1-carboxyvinyltransferase [Oscillospiraceae bacterium]|nr:UDP-N-acetylglucosamine 1-carboxyvinyltransferase [Oscillospiraceae bacterium]
MECWHIRGGRRLNGACFVQGSKNASLPILAASLVCPAETELENVPRLRDVDAALRILRHLGCKAEQRGTRVYIDSRVLDGSEIPHELMEEMRSSVIFMGALIARCGQARLSLPGGCQLGKRPIDQHLAALRQMGARIEEDRGEICCRPSALRGEEIRLPFPSVGATENIMLAACTAGGRTVIRGAAKEPEIAALQDYLRAMGAEVAGAGTDTVVVDGFHPQSRVGFRIRPDRIVAATLACAAAAAGGDVELRGIDPGQFSTVLDFLNRAGCDIITSDRSVRLRSDGRLKAVGEVVTAPYPGFPTDAQPVLMAALLRARGRTAITETIFENRFRQVPELCRLGADVTVSGRTAEIWGVERLKGAALTATDLRGGAAMIVAGLSAEGETLLFDEGHITRGYERFDARLRALGADVVLEY